MQERFHDCAKLGKSTISRLKEYGNQIRESLQAEQSKSQQLEEKIKILAQDRAILQSEKIHLEQQAKIMQQNLDSKDLCQASDSSTQQTSGSEHHETDSEVKLKSLRQHIQEMEQEHKRTGPCSKLRLIEVNAHLIETKRPVFVPSLIKERIKKMECDRACMRREKKQQESLNMILKEKLDSLHNLCEQKDKALQRKLAQEEVERCVKEIKADGPKKEIRNLKKRIQEIDEINDDTQSGLKTEISAQKIKAQENWTVVCALRRTLGLERKEMTKLSKKFASGKLAGYQRRPVKVSTSSQQRQPLHNPGGVLRSASNNVEESGVANDVLTQEKFAEAVEERNLYLRKLQAEEKKTKSLEDDSASGKSEEKLNMEKLQAEKMCEQLEERIKKMECDRACMRSEKKQQESLNMILKEKLDILHNLCEQKDKALQRKLAQEEVERCVKEIKADGPKKEIRNLKKRIQEIDEINDDTQSGLKTEIAAQKIKAQENWTVVCALRRTLGLERKEMTKLSKKLSEVSGKLAGYQRRPVKVSTSSQQRQPLRNPGGVLSSASNNVEESGDVLTQEKFAEAVEERNLYRRKLQAEEKKTKSLEENVQALKEDHKALEKETLNFQIEINSYNGKLHDMIELCQKKDQALLRKASQIDYERRVNELKIKEVLRSHSWKGTSTEEQHLKAEFSYKAEIDHLRKKLQDNSANQRKACYSEHALAAHKKEIKDFCRQLDQASCKQADLQTLSVPTPGCSHWETPC
ncbi:hypothetical protein AAFF_G00358530 [Aldrovandia affinis]|uniref:Uncharacterized protein n=1 Tax=Aldrovandia affinis TaxID=143900 RepID=A0AAD7X187_9TELE|nr:hypothetical protein AAFF_G00358530 [Aldrovandia affinis]